jgi:hypothetical protein
MVPGQRRLAGWRQKPRHALRGEHLRRWHFFYLIALVTGVLIAVQYLAVAVTGGRAPSGSEWRLGNALYGLAGLVFAVALTTLGVLHLRRPLLPEDDWLPGDRDVPPDVRLRTEAEESAREHRSGSGF